MEFLAFQALKFVFPCSLHAFSPFCNASGAQAGTTRGRFHDGLERRLERSERREATASKSSALGSEPLHGQLRAIARP